MHISCFSVLNTGMRYITLKTNGVSMVQVVEAYAKLIMHRHAASVTAKRFYVWNVFHCKVIPTLPGRRIKSAEKMATDLTENERVWRC